MKKYIKLLLEGLFDDFDDIFTDGEDLEDTINKAVQYNSLTDCNSIEDVENYIINKFDIIDTIVKICDIIRANNLFDKSSAEDVIKPFKQLIESGKIGVEPKHFYYRSYYDKKDYDRKIYITINIFNGQGIKLVFKQAQKEFPDIIYRNKPIRCEYTYFTSYYNDDIIGKEDENMYIIFALTHYKRQPINSHSARFSKSQQTYVPVETGDHPKLTQMKDDYINNMDLYGKINEFVLKYFEDILHIDKMLNELKIEGKVYPVVQKDYDRMINCFSWSDKKRSQALAGFDKITKPEKMIARIVAYFIAAKNTNSSDSMFQLNDDTLFSYLFYNPKWKSRWSNNLTLQMLTKIKDFPSLHLKDVIATYNAYKDKF